ncbi:hypothetical protein tb265_06080 [Gemmatimonadetes bacterium T265]|nr:hypothetical protein tb265_06080 [Gemmatimonadetes bacterium T265]
MRRLGKRLAVWAAWVGVLAAMAAALATRRGHIDQVHVVLPLLLVILAGSATEGRALGLVLAAEAAVLVDYVFQPPYDTLTVAKPLDWVVLVAFFVTAGVATQLLEVARAEATAARRRADEVGELAGVGAEALGVGEADAAVRAVAAAFARTLALDGCAISDAAGAPLAATGHVPSGAGAPAAGLRAALAAAPADVVVPLRTSGRVVGALRLARAGGVRADASRLAFLEALAHYAALAAERVRLVAEAERAEALREADRMKDQLLAAVSHDLRTPLTTIKALAHDSARRGDANAAVIEEQADRLTRIVADLLDLSRARAGGVVVHPELNTAEDVVGALRRQVAGVLGAGPQPRPLVVDLPVDDPPLAGTFDFVATLRILGNLVENANKYAASGAPVELAAYAADGALVFEVRDRGPGVPAGERERIFTPFYRGAGAPADVGGAGLGLATARALAEAQGGTLAYAAREGGGSVFVLRLPGAAVGTSRGTTRSCGHSRGPPRSRG